MTKELRYSLLITFGSLLVLMLRVPLEASLNEFLDNHLLSDLTAGSAIRVLLIIGLLYFIINKGFLPFNGLYPSFTVSNLFLLYGAVAVIIVLAYSSYEIYIDTKPDRLFLFGISNALVGVFEELLFRGIVFPLLIIHFTGKERPILRAAFLSSVLFGLIHLVGLIRHPEKVFNVINVVIYAIGIGFLFACLLMRTRNILVPAFIHFLVDFTNGANDLKEEVVVPAVPTQSTIILSLAVVTALALIFIGIGLFLFKRVKKEEWLHKISYIKV